MPEQDRNLHCALSSQPVSEMGMTTLEREAPLLLKPHCISMPEFADLAAAVASAYANLELTTEPESMEYHGKMTKALLPAIVASQGSITKAANVATFPGDVPADAPRVGVTMTVRGQYEGYPTYFGFAQASRPLMVSTGLYAAPGEIVTVTISQDFLDESNAGANSGFTVHDFLQNTIQCLLYKKGRVAMIKVFCFGCFFALFSFLNLAPFLINQSEYRIELSSLLLP